MTTDGDRMPLAPSPWKPGDEAFGSVVIVLNAHGVAVAYGPYGEGEAHDLAEFLAPVAAGTWLFVLDDHDAARYNGGDDGLLPASTPLRPASVGSGDQP